MSLSDAASVPAPEAGRPLVFRGGTVLTMDAASTVLTEADVLVVGDRIEAVGPALEVPASTHEIDARGGIVLPAGSSAPRTSPRATGWRRSSPSTPG
jgi:adenine deaminase